MRLRTSGLVVLLKRAPGYGTMQRSAKRPANNGRYQNRSIGVNHELGRYKAPRALNNPIIAGPTTARRSVTPMSFVTIPVRDRIMAASGSSVIRCYAESESRVDYTFSFRKTPATKTHRPKLIATTLMSDEAPNIATTITTMDNPQAILSIVRIIRFMVLFLFCRTSRPSSRGTVSAFLNVIGPQPSVRCNTDCQDAFALRISLERRILSSISSSARTSK